MKKKSILQSIFSVSGLIILAKLLGFVKQLLIANAFGTTLETDLINLAQNFIIIIQGPVLDALPTALIAIYLGIPEQNETERKAFLTRVLRLAALISLALGVLIFLFSPWISRILGSAYSAEQLANLTGYIRLYSPLVFCIILMAVFVAALNANRRFGMSEIRSVLMSAVMMLTIWLFRGVWGAETISWGYVGYVLISFVVLSLASRRYFGRAVWDNPLKDDSVRAMLKMTGPLFIGYGITYINSLVDQSIASRLQEGSVTAMGNAWVLYCLVTAFITMFSTILFTHVTENVSAERHAAAADLILRAAKILTALFLPVSIIAVLCSADVVSIVYGRGAYGPESVRITALSLCGYCLSFVPFVLRELFTRFQYAYKESRRPMINSAISIALNIVLSILLSRFWGLFGISFATSISVILCAVLNYFSARRLNPELRNRADRKDYLLMALGGVVCLVCVLVGQKLLAELQAWLRFGLITVVSCLIYFVVICPVALRLWREWKTERNEE